MFIPNESTLKLYNYADGVNGHYCVGYKDGGGIHYFWNGEKFSSVGVVLKERVVADALLNALNAAVRYNRAGETTIANYRDEVKQANALLDESISENKKYKVLLDKLRVQAL